MMFTGLLAKAHRARFPHRFATITAALHVSKTPLTRGARDLSRSQRAHIANRSACSTQLLSNALLLKKLSQSKRRATRLKPAATFCQAFRNQNKHFGQKCLIDTLIKFDIKHGAVTWEKFSKIFSRTFISIQSHPQRSTHRVPTATTKANTTGQIHEPHRKAFMAMLTIHGGSAFRRVGFLSARVEATLLYSVTPRARKPGSQ